MASCPQDGDIFASCPNNILYVLVCVSMYVYVIVMQETGFMHSKGYSNLFTATSGMIQIPTLPASWNTSPKMGQLIGT